MTESFRMTESLRRIQKYSGYERLAGDAFEIFLEFGVVADLGGGGTEFVCGIGAAAFFFEDEA